MSTNEHTEKLDVYSRVTSAIINAIETGVGDLYRCQQSAASGRLADSA